MHKDFIQNIALQEKYEKTKSEMSEANIHTANRFIPLYNLMQMVVDGQYRKKLDSCIRRMYDASGLVGYRTQTAHERAIAKELQKSIVIKISRSEYPSYTTDFEGWKPYFRPSSSTDCMVFVFEDPGECDIIQYCAYLPITLLDKDEVTEADVQYYMETILQEAGYPDNIEKVWGHTNYV